MKTTGKSTSLNTFSRETDFLELTQKSNRSLIEYAG